MSRDVHDIPAKTDLKPTQKVTITIEAAGQTIEVSYHGDELLSGVKWQDTSTEPETLEEALGRTGWYPTNRYHLDLEVRRASNFTMRVIEEPA